MVRKLTIVAGLFAMGTMLGPQLASSATAPQTLIGTEGTLVQKAQYGSCHYWRHECARRWGWRTHGYYRCLRRHDCD